MVSLPAWAEAPGSLGTLPPLGQHGQKSGTALIPLLLGHLRNGAKEPLNLAVSEAISFIMLPLGLLRLGGQH
eukprot:6809385-Lingulodinium_polyedra.AAC.1